MEISYFYKDACSNLFKAAPELRAMATPRPTPMIAAPTVSVFYVIGKAATGPYLFVFYPIFAAGMNALGL